MRVYATQRTLNTMVQCTHIDSAACSMHNLPHAQRQHSGHTDLAVRMEANPLKLVHRRVARFVREQVPDERLRRIRQQCRTDGLATHVADWEAGVAANGTGKGRHREQAVGMQRDKWKMV